MILGIEISSPNGSISLVKNKKVIAEKKIPGSLNHDRSFIPTLDKLLLAANTQLNRIKGIGVSLGPGSFTGIRIGIAAAYGLSFSKDIPLIGIPTMNALLHQEVFSNPKKLALLKEKGAILVPMIEAKKTHVFAGFYKISKSDKLRTLQKPNLYRTTDIAITDEHYIFGVGNNLPSRAKQIKPKAATIALLAEERLKTGKPTKHLKPIYIWDFTPSPKRQFIK